MGRIAEFPRAAALGQLTYTWHLSQYPLLFYSKYLSIAFVQLQGRPL